MNQFFIRISRHIMQERLAKGIRNTHLVQLLLEARDAHGNRLSENEILGQFWVIFLARYETTMATLNYCLYELALHQNIQERLHDFLRYKTGSGKNMDYETIGKIDFLESIILEVLRKYPPVIRLERRAAEDYRLQGTDIWVKRGQMVEIPIYAVHHSPDNFPQPEAFDARRFMPQNRKSIKPYTFLPFGQGPPNCIGMKFALMEIKLALTMLVLRFRFEPSPRSQNRIAFNPVTPFLVTKHNYLKATKRDNN